MVSFIDVKDAGDKRVAAFLSLKVRQLAREGAFIAEGPKVIKALSKSDIRIFSCLTTRSFCSKHRQLLSKFSKGRIPVYLMPKSEIEKVVGFNFHQGIMAACRIPRRMSPEEGLKRLKGPRLVVALNGVNDPENVGLIARNMAAFGAGAMVVDGKTHDPYYRRAVRVSMGAIFSFPVIYVDKLAPALERLRKEEGFRIVAASLGRGSRDIKAVDLTRDTCVVFGNEDKGLDRDVLRASDAAVKIPMTKKVDSLNVASASAIILREAFLQRG